MSGLAAQLGWAEEVTYGTYVAPTKFGEFVSESMALDKRTVTSTGLRAGGQYPRVGNRYVTSRQAGGSIAMDVSSRGMGLLFKHALGTPAPAATVIGTTSFYRQVHIPGSIATRSLSLQVGKPQTDGTVQPFSYPGSKITEWELGCSADELLRLSMTVDARDEDDGQALGVYSNVITGEEKFHWSQLAITIGGTVTTTAGLASVAGAAPLNGCKGWSARTANQLATDLFYANGLGLKSGPVGNGWRGTTGSLSCDFLAKTQLYNTYKPDTTTALEFVFTGHLATGGSVAKLRLLLPAVKLDTGSPTVGGPALLPNNINFTVLDDLVNAPVQLVYESLDSAV